MTPKTEQELKQRIDTLNLAIADSKQRQYGHLPKSHYFQNQNDRQHEWGVELNRLEKQLAQITAAPIIGVIEVNNTNLAYTEMLFGDSINITFDNARAKHEKHCSNSACYQSNHQDWADKYESDSDDMILIGDWVKDSDGLWQPDKEKEFAAIVRNNVAQVVWSKTTVRVKEMCSPCYPGQADLDSGEDTSGTGILAYTLPKELTEGL